MPLEYSVWVKHHLYPYAGNLMEKLHSGKMSRQQFEHLMNKLDEWEKHYVDKYGEFYDFEEDE